MSVHDTVSVKFVSVLSELCYRVYISFSEKMEIIWRKKYLSVINQVLHISKVDQWQSFQMVFNLLSHILEPFCPSFIICK